MHLFRTVWRPWLGVCVILMLLLAPLGPVQHAAAADGSLVITALHVLEQEYVDPVDPVQVLNGAVAILRKATNLSADQLPDLVAGTSETDAQDGFVAEFARAAQTGAMPETQLAYAATAGMLASLHDSHTFFLDPSQLRESRRQLFGNPSFTGVGVTITSRKDSAGVAWIFIENVFPGSPARDAGLKRFDKIVEVDGKTLMNVNTVDASQLIRGPAGSTANLSIQRAGQTLRVPVVRAPIRVPPIESEFVQPGVAYVKVFEFSQGAGRNVRSALEQLSADQSIRSLVLDLRGNPGGLIVEAAAVSSIFLPPRTVLATVKERGSQPSVLRTSGTPLLPHTPIVILVDGGSASASEIVTGAFKEYQRASIVGDKTAGAVGGSVTVTLPEGGMSVTVERILTPRNEQVEGVGIAPDVPVALTVADMERGEDTQLQAALHALGVAWTRCALSAA
jgi:carboxyl-terminal processing protease